MNPSRPNPRSDPAGAEISTQLPVLEKYEWHRSGCADVGLHPVARLATVSRSTPATDTAPCTRDAISAGVVIGCVGSSPRLPAEIAMNTPLPTAYRMASSMAVAHPA